MAKPTTTKSPKGRNKPSTADQPEQTESRCIPNDGIYVNVNAPTGKDDPFNESSSSPESEEELEELPPDRSMSAERLNN